jgi:hypothetical protein
MSDLLNKAEAEVRRRHDFFVAWFTGRAEAEDMALSMRSFAPDMQRIGPDGGFQTAAEVIKMVENARGVLDGRFEIRIDLLSARLINPDIALLVYNEHQSHVDKRNSRRSTALFSADRQAPEGVVWRHLQETWIAA